MVKTRATPPRGGLVASGVQKVGSIFWQSKVDWYSGKEGLNVFMNAFNNGVQVSGDLLYIPYKGEGGEGGRVGGDPGLSPPPPLPRITLR